MGLNNVISQLAYDLLNRYDRDSKLYDAIVEGDCECIIYLANKVYRTEIINRSFIKEPIDLAKMIGILEQLLNTKSVNVRMC